MMTWTEGQAIALQAVFTALNESPLEWMVLRNYEGLPHNNRSKDIDIICRKNDFPQAHRVISQAMKKYGYCHEEHTRFQCIWCFTFYNINAGLPSAIKIDILDGFVWRGAQVIDFSDLYASKVSYADFFVPDQLHDGFMLWIKPLMTGGFVKDKYRHDILQSLARYPQEFRALLEKTFGAGMAQKVWPYLANGDLDATTPYQIRLCHAAWRVALLKNPFKTLSATIEHGYREIRRRAFRPKGSMVAVVGPDGAGKSTFIELLQKELCRCLVKDADDVRILHFRPNIFPNLKKLLSGKTYDESAEKFTDPHRAKPAGRVSSVLRLSYYWLDYLLGYWLRIRSRCIAGKVYVFDRYCYDFIVDPYRSRVKLPDWLRLFFMRMVPEPDLVFFLNCDAATIYSRKQELTQAEIERQLQAYRMLARKNKRFVTLDANKTPTVLCKDAVQHLIEVSFGRI